MTLKEPSSIGTRSEHIFAFAREFEGRRAVVVVPRLMARNDAWSDTTLRVPAMHGREVFTGKAHDLNGDVPVSQLLADFPVALLIAHP